ncbi:MAG: CPXCG motif-containing cysteine-rich protein [Candidatus Wallbacteria bacterium]|jgi:endogenous inhibitor of DNA gyrase (YacG/DUF329 family)|nr:CPXCG motif-containing cysteine-rich protein [Candidatus Wallbacteria bacterium]
MAYQDTYDIDCPYCGETISLDFDFSEGDAQSFEIDCPVCCRPVDVAVRHTADGITAGSERER